MLRLHSSVDGGTEPVFTNMFHSMTGENLERPIRDDMSLNANFCAFSTLTRTRTVSSNHDKLDKTVGKRFAITVVVTGDQIREITGINLLFVEVNYQVSLIVPNNLCAYFKVSISY